MNSSKRRRSPLDNPTAANSVELTTLGMPPQVPPRGLASGEGPLLRTPRGAPRAGRRLRVPPSGLRFKVHKRPRRVLRLRPSDANGAAL